jgi:hypothetical protein
MVFITIIDKLCSIFRNRVTVKFKSNVGTVMIRGFIIDLSFEYIARLDNSSDWDYNNQRHWFGL